MTADEIRAQKFVCDDGARETARWLQEIAAQLAALNATLRTHLEAEKVLKAVTTGLLP